MMSAILLIVGAALFSYSTHVLFRPDHRSTTSAWLRRLPDNPGRALVYRVVGMMLLFLGTIVADGVTWYWMGGITLVLVLSSIAFTVTRNRRIDRKERPRSDEWRPAHASRARGPGQAIRTQPRRARIRSRRTDGRTGD